MSEGYRYVPKWEFFPIFAQTKNRKNHIAQLFCYETYIILFKIDAKIGPMIWNNLVNSFHSIMKILID